MSVPPQGDDAVCHRGNVSHPIHQGVDLAGQEAVVFRSGFHAGGRHRDAHVSGRDGGLHIGDKINLAIRGGPGCPGESPPARSGARPGVKVKLVVA